MTDLIETFTYYIIRLTEHEFLKSVEPIHLFNLHVVPTFHLTNAYRFVHPDSTTLVKTQYYYPEAQFLEVTQITKANLLPEKVI